MSAHIKDGHTTARVLERHGTVGHVQLFATVPPYLKDALIEAARDRGLTLRDAIEQAIRQWVNTAAQEAI